MFHTHVILDYMYLPVLSISNIHGTSREMNCNISNISILGPFMQSMCGYFSCRRSSFTSTLLSPLLSSTLLTLILSMNIIPVLNVI
jgi:hypothetical protein